MLPFEFRIKGPPVSSQTRNRQRLQYWKQQVALAAEAALNRAHPCNCEVRLTITYYYEGASPDVDNIIKPIQDALIGCVYLDDDQVADTRSRKRSLDGSYKLRGASPTLVLGFADGDDFLHILIEEHVESQDLNQ